MGAYLSEPVTEKFSEDDSTERISYGASSMQGWRVSQEDAHNCIPDFDDKTCFFAVYDGHGGAEVAQYCASYLPGFIKSSDVYKGGNVAQALEDAFLDFDATLIKDEVLLELKNIAGISDNADNAEDDAENEVNYLHEEAHMPLEELLARYHKAGIENQLLRNAKKDKKLQSLSLKSKASPGNTDEFKPGPSCAFVNNKEKSSPSQDKSMPSDANLENDCKMEPMAGDKPTAEDVPAASMPNCKPHVGGGESDCELTQVNGTVKDLTKQEECSDPLKLPSNDTVHTPNSASNSNSTKTPEVNGEIEKSEDSPEKCSDNLSPQEKSVAAGKGKGKGKGKSVLGFNLGPGESPKDSEPKTKKKPLRVGGHRQARPTSMEDTSGDSQESESDEEYEGVPSEQDSGDENDENQVGKMDDDDDEESDESDEEDDDDEEEEEDETENSFVVSEKEEPGYDSGCTAVVALLRGDELYVANAGDSRCVVCRSGKAIEMSHDHKPEDEVEMKRIVAAGGKVTTDGRVNGGLNLSRAIGDHSYKKNESLPLRDQMISSLPDIRTLTIDPNEDEFMVIACDGIWNFMNSQEVVDFVRERVTNEKKLLSGICEELFNKCLSPTTIGDGTGCDNMTCIVVKFHHNPSSDQDSGKRCNDHFEEQASKRVKTLGDRNNP